jgi:hypothetical protein
LARRKKDRKNSKINFNEWEDVQDIQGGGLRKNKRRKERRNGKYNLKGVVDGFINNEEYMDNIDK